MPDKPQKGALVFAMAEMRPPRVCGGCRMAPAGSLVYAHATREMAL